MTINVDHRTATVNGINIHYVVQGEGAPVILLHGLARILVQLAGADSRLVRTLPGHRSRHEGVRVFGQARPRL